MLLGFGLSNTGLAQAPVSSGTVITLQPEGADLRLTWTTVGGKSYLVQTNAPAPSGSFTNNFADFSPLITMPGTGEATTNYLELGAATSGSARYYRIRLEP